jgi:hypothetical protein
MLTLFRAVNRLQFFSRARMRLGACLYSTIRGLAGVNAGGDQDPSLSRISSIEFRAVESLGDWVTDRFFHHIARFEFRLEPQDRPLLLEQ